MSYSYHSRQTAIYKFCMVHQNEHTMARYSPTKNSVVIFFLHKSLHAPSLSCSNDAFPMFKHVIQVIQSRHIAILVSAKGGETGSQW